MGISCPADCDKDYLPGSTVDLFAVPVQSELWLLFPWDAELKPNEPLARHRGGLAKGS